MHKLCLHCRQPIKTYPQNVKRQKFCGKPCVRAWNRRPELVTARFWAKVRKADGDACWTWLGARSSVTRYGTFNYHGHNINAHRAAWLLTNGPIDGKDIDVLHRCNKGHEGCVRPDHLYLGTHKQNMLDKIAAGRSLRGELGPRAKLTEEQAVAILSLKDSGYFKKGVARSLAEEHGVRIGTIHAIWRGHTWKHLQ
jgi:hypothetical protein